MVNEDWRSMSRYVLKTRADSPELRKAAMVIEQSAWAPLGFLNFTRAHFEHYQRLLDEHADCQLCLVDQVTGYPVAVGNCVPITCNVQNLPAEGWDWIVENAADRSKEPRNAIGALAISVPGIHRGKGVARELIAGFRQLAADRGYYGRAYDPWLRSHLSAGGRIVGPAARSMVVEEPVAFWETWAGRAFPQSGDYEIEGALAPVSIRRESDLGSYIEPNVWFAYAA
jgi:GNAT superfamily N-acetyltransferase